METAVQKAKKRVLPPWMAAGEVEPTKNVSAVRPKRAKKTAVASPSRHVTVYCMNEAELVDVALGVLAERCVVRGTKGSVPAQPEGEQEGQQMLTESPGSPARCIRTGTPRLDSKPLAQPAALGCASRSDTEDEDDALKYVREIFFS
ncbi:cell cycle regulator of non-homologous end joining [Carettochelys insculpta]|uniref:cell cycle regulator of non-homologous end joining n=1 Tax=Carettochelys insculpta TaxID=44489 RepID=UPI003EC09ECC